MEAPGEQQVGTTPGEAKPKREHLEYKLVSNEQAIKVIQ